MSASLQRAIYQAKADWFAYLAATWDNEDALPYPAASRKVLENWTAPAEGPGEATMALQYALEQYRVGDTPVIPAMMAAVLGYLEGSAT